MKYKLLKELVKVCRSKNSSPFELTLDIIFRNESDYQSLKNANFFTVSLFAEIYQLPETAIQSVVYFDPALAVKANIARRVISGSPGDSDVYGAQQHAPLLDLIIPSTIFCSSTSS